MSAGRARRRPVRRSGRGTLVVIAALFLGSGALRLTGEAGQAVARGLETGATEGIPRSETEVCRTDAELGGLLSALIEREEALSLRAGEIADRSRALEVAETDIARQLAALEAAEQRLSATLATAATAAENDIGTLAAVYANMKPKDAAALFAEMSPAFAAGFLGRMAPETAAAIMAGLEPRTAYTISVMLAGRNAAVPTE